MCRRKFYALCSFKEQGFWFFGSLDYFALWLRSSSRLMTSRVIRVGVDDPALTPTVVIPSNHSALRSSAERKAADSQKIGREQAFSVKPWRGYAPLGSPKITTCEKKRVNTQNTL